VERFKKNRGRPRASGPPHARLSQRDILAGRACRLQRKNEPARYGITLSPVS
jgi:hypothetical protein